MANPATLLYVRDVELPHASDHGIELHVLREIRRDGTVETLHGYLVQPRVDRTPLDGPSAMRGVGWRVSVGSIPTVPTRLELTEIVDSCVSAFYGT
jgi:hypothetical protein